MNKYQYFLSNFQAINKADIKLDGITVLAGANGCGKSTLSRWLYYIVNTINQYKELVVKSFIRSKSLELMNILRIMNIEFDMRPVLSSREIQEINDIETFSDIYHRIYSDFLDSIIQWVNKRAVTKSRKTRLASYFNIPYSDNTDEFSANIIAYCNSKNDEFDKEARLAIIHRNKNITNKLFKFISENYDEKLNQTSEIQLYEGDTPLIDENDFHYIYRLKKAIYIDTPMALGHKDYRSRAWTDLQNMMINEFKEKPEGADRIIFSISRIIGGNFTVESDFLKNKEIHFVSADGLDIELEKAATGLNSFAYLQMLLKNGYLDSDTLLLIDEPEAHLHPQWIVEFARLLVNIHKKLGVYIMVASHNPDMVSAIRSISKKEDLADKTNFYLAVKEKDSLKYTYEYLGTDISRIFESFNIALSRINEYGE